MTTGSYFRTPTRSPLTLAVVIRFSPAFFTSLPVCFVHDHLIVSLDACFTALFTLSHRCIFSG